MGYAYYAQITIDHSKVPSDLTDFPVLISGTYDGTDGEPDLRTTANGGHIENTDANGGASGGLTVPADLVFSPNTDGSSPYDFEIEKYDATTGEIVAWVQCDLDGAADTVLYVVYGDSEVTTSQEDVTGTWGAGFECVWHFGEPSGTLHDSTANNRDSTGVNGSPTYGVTGKIGNAMSFGGGGESADFPALAFSTSESITFEAWFMTDTIASQYAHLIDRATAVNALLDFFRDYDDFWWRIRDDNKIPDAGSTVEAVDVLSTATWYYAVGIRNVSADEIELFINAVSKGTATDGTGTTISIAPRVGTHSSGSPSWEGDVDEVRISSVARSDDWITTCYNNQSDPATFYSMGSEQGVAITQGYGFIM